VFELSTNGLREIGCILSISAIVAFSDGSLPTGLLCLFFAFCFFIGHFIEEKSYAQREYENKQHRQKLENIQMNKVATVKDVEKISMNATVKYENNYNRNPLDVSKENRGYDIISSNNIETRHIEVKGLSLDSYDSYVLFTKNEYEKAKEMCNNFFLYIVSNCGSDRQQLYVIKNPASVLNIVYNSETNKYKILLNDVKQKVNYEYI